MDRKDLENLVYEQTKRAYGGATKGNPFSAGMLAGGNFLQPRGKNYKAMFGDSLTEGGFDSFEDFLRAADGGRDTRLKTMEESGTGAGEGYLIPSQYVAQLLDDSLEKEIVRPRCKVWKMDGPSIKIPGYRITDHDTSIHGVVTYWGDEATSMTDSDLEFRMIQMNANKLYAYTKSSNELVEDSKIPFASVIGPAFASAIGFELDYRAFQGTGANQPLGILNSDCLVEISKETGQAADSIEYDNLVKMLGRLSPGSWANSVWVASISTVPELLTLTIAVGTAGSHVKVVSESGGRFFILGKEILFTEKLPVLGDKGDIILADFSQYSMALRKDLRVESTGAAHFQSDIRDFRGVLRCDGQTSWDSSLELKDGTTTVSPFICIEERT